MNDNGNSGLWPAEPGWGRGPYGKTTVTTPLRKAKGKKEAHTNLDYYWYSDWKSPMTCSPRILARLPLRPVPEDSTAGREPPFGGALGTAGGWWSEHQQRGRYWESTDHRRNPRAASDWNLMVLRSPFV
ncbi:hypothetical protein DTO169C6_5278 [Paecilomyces variotii]|nr:hypothetical protein DTO169C6_5278 [Paecilomyces variotii]KAJ9357806.1 hypothetical protein DTO027B9_2733 [Paecilomyces variotii]